MSLKLCGWCKIEKLETEFWRSEPRYCIECKAARARLYHKRTYQARRHVVRNSRLKYSFGIDLIQYQQMYEDQQGLCWICQKSDDQGKMLAVDHNHVTGEVRGLLCTRCNSQLLPGAQEDIKILQRAIQYLTKQKD